VVWQGGECIPCCAAGVDDCVVDAIAEEVLPQELPDVLDRIEFWRIGRQVQQADVVGYAQCASQLMPSGTIEQHDGVRARCDVGADLGPMELIASALASGRTSAAPTPRAGQTTPKM
jgi:hypothetical protein